MLLWPISLISVHFTNVPDCYIVGFAMYSIFVRGLFDKLQNSIIVLVFQI